MAKKQTRRSVSLARVIHAAITKEAERRGMSASHFVESLVRRAIKGLPKTEHVPAAQAKLARTGLRAALAKPKPTTRQLDALAERVAAVLARKAGKRVRLPKRKPLEAKRTGGDAIDQAMADVPAPDTAGLSLVEGEYRNRKRSAKLAKVLRDRGLLLPENEGYAPGSWAAP